MKDLKQPLSTRFKCLKIPPGWTLHTETFLERRGDSKATSTIYVLITDSYLKQIAERFESIRSFAEIQRIVGKDREAEGKVKPLALSSRIEMSIGLPGISGKVYTSYCFFLPLTLVPNLSNTLSLN